MLTRDEYIKISLEYNLFWIRIMKEHAIFIESSLPPTEKQLSQRADRFRHKYDNLLANAIMLSKGAVSKEALESTQYYTRFTEEAERVTAKLTGIEINCQLTQQEYNIDPKSPHVANSLRKEQEVSFLNQAVITQTISFIEFKTELLNLQTSCRLNTFLYTALLEHILKEARWYCDILMELQKKNTVTQDYKEFWIEKMVDHAKVMRGLFDPSELNYFDQADQYARIFDAFTHNDRSDFNLRYPGTLDSNNILIETGNFSQFKANITNGLLQCNIRAMMLPLFTDHLLREANHFIFLMR